jgi:hypothetical protein
VSKGAEIGWYDPLVSSWEGSNPVDKAWDCDVAILATKQPGMDIEPLLEKGIHILDCTNSISSLKGVTSL